MAERRVVRTGTVLQVGADPDEVRRTAPPPAGEDEQRTAPCTSRCAAG
ncbi:hypothetical protein ACFVT1_34545 [Streptomyces sp. NPDC057963]